MPISAFGQQGRLKKNPLLGSSLKQDPDREEERTGFMGLHNEARQAGLGLKGMSDRLRNRASSEGAPEFNRLQLLGKQRKKMSDAYTANRDMGKEADFAGYQNYMDLEGPDYLFDAPVEDFGLVNTSEGDPHPASYFPEYADFSGHGISNEYRDSILPDWEALGEAEGGRKPRYDPRAGGAVPLGGVSDGSGMTPEAYMSLLTGSWSATDLENSQNISSYVKDRFETERGPDAKTAYDSGLEEIAATYDESFVPMGEESELIKKRMADRVNLYNMFLGV